MEGGGRRFKVSQGYTVDPISKTTTEQKQNSREKEAGEEEGRQEEGKEDLEIYIQRTMGHRQDRDGCLHPERHGTGFPHSLPWEWALLAL